MTESIDFTKSEQYTLSIRLSTDGFSFSIYDPFGSSRLFFRPYTVNPQRSMAANVKAFLSETEELKYPYKQTNILIHSSRYTPVPLEIFEDEQMEDLFYQNLPKQNNEIVLCNILGKSNLVILFSLDKLTHQFLTDTFPQARFFASVSPQTELLAGKSKLGNNCKLYTQLHPHSLDVFCFDRGRLQLLNTYPVSTLEDRCYYLLNVWKATGYDQERDELHLAGSLPQREELIANLKKYIRKVFIINPQAELHPATDIPAEEIPFDIQALLICE